MKKSRLIPVLGVLLLAVVFTVSKFSKNDNSMLFLSTDNIAYADVGCVCIPQAKSICVSPYGAMYDYILDCSGNNQE